MTASAIITPSQYFRSLDLSKLDDFTAAHVRESILSYPNLDLLAGTREFTMIQEIIDENFPEAISGKKIKKQAAKPSSKSDKEILEEKIIDMSSQLEETDVLIELMQDTVKANPKDQDSKDYLELLEETSKALKEQLSALKGEKKEEGGAVQEPSKWDVQIDWQSASGNARSDKYAIDAIDEQEAISKAEAKVKAKKDFMKIEGGSAVKAEKKEEGGTVDETKYMLRGKPYSAQELISIAAGESEYDRRDADAEPISTLEEALDWFNKVEPEGEKVYVVNPAT